MPRRVHIPDLRPGRLPLPADTAHYLLAVLRLPDGATVEAFDSAGRVAPATLHAGPPALIEITSDPVAGPATMPLTVASAVPKGDRADYLVEKLGELGVARWVPLRTNRSVVHPDGASKFARWERIAVEAARQSHAPAVLQIAPLAAPGDLASLIVSPADAVPQPPVVWVCSTRPDALPALSAPPPAAVLVGPEGGWTDDELAAFAHAGHTHVSLGPTVLRVETAALVAAALALAHRHAHA